MTQHKKRNRGPAAAIAGSVTLLAAGVVTSVLVASVPPPGAAGTSAGVTVLAHHGKAQPVVMPRPVVVPPAPARHVPGPGGGAGQRLRAHRPG